MGAFTTIALNLAAAEVTKNVPGCQLMADGSAREVLERQAGLQMFSVGTSDMPNSHQAVPTHTSRGQAGAKQSRHTLPSRHSSRPHTFFPRAIKRPGCSLLRGTRPSCGGGASKRGAAPPRHARQRQPASEQRRGLAQAVPSAAVPSARARGGSAGGGAEAGRLPRRALHLNALSRRPILLTQAVAVVMAKRGVMPAAGVGSTTRRNCQ